MQINQGEKKVTMAYLQEGTFFKAYGTKTKLNEDEIKGLQMKVDAYANLHYEYRLKDKTVRGVVPVGLLANAEYEEPEETQAKTGRVKNT